MGWGSPAVTLEGGVLVTNAGSVEQLSGDSSSVGASVGEGVSAGLDGSWGEDSNGNSIWSSFASVGLGAYAPFPAELHGGFTRTARPW